MWRLGAADKATHLASGACEPAAHPKALAGIRTRDLLSTKEVLSC